MALDYILLELRKNRLIFIGLTGSFFVSLPLMALAWARSRYPAAQGIDATLAFWTLLGLPGAALLFGGASGAELRSESAESAEGPLPLSPLGRVGGALTACGFHLALLAVLVVLLSFAASPAWRSVFLERSNSVPLAQPFFLLLTFTLTDLLILSFVASYCLRSGILGGLLGILLGGLTTLCLVVGLALEIPFRERSSFAGASAWVAAAALGGGLFALCSAASLMERRRRSSTMRILGIAAGLGLGTLSAYAILSRSFESLFQSMYLYHSRSVRFKGEGLSDTELFPAARKASAQGVLMMSMDGKLDWIKPSGDRATLLRGERRTLGDFLVRPHWDSIKSTAWDKDGRLWVMTRPDTAEYEIWSGPAQGPLTLYRRNQDKNWLDSFARSEGELGMLSWSSRSWNFAELPRPGAPPRWRNVGPDRGEFLMRGWVRTGWAATLGEDRASLIHAPQSGRETRWRLPGKALSSRQKHVLAAMVGGKKAFMVPVRRAGGAALAVCRPGGACALEWPSDAEASYDLSSNPDGSLWGRRDRRTLQVVSAEGRFLPPLRLADASGAGPQVGARVLRASGGHVWMVLNHAHLVKLDAETGKPLNQWPLPDTSILRRERESSLHVAEDGFFMHTGKRLFFIGWDGRAKSLGPA